MKATFALLVLAIGGANAIRADDDSGLDLSRPTEATLPADATRRWSLNVDAGEYAEVRVGLQPVHEGEDFGLDIDLFDPVGLPRRRTVTRQGRCAPSGVRTLAWVGEPAGSWSVVLANATGQPLDVFVEWVTRRPATEDDRLAATAQTMVERFEASLSPGSAESPEAVRELLRAASELQERRFSADPSTLAAFFAEAAYDLSIGFVLPELQVELAQRALDLRRASLADDDLCLAETYSLLSAALDGADRLDESIETEQRALAIYESRLGSGDYDVFISVDGLSRTLVKSGRYSEARPYLDRALVMAQEIDPIEVAYVYHSFGEFYWRTNQYDAALEALTRSLELFDGFGDDGADAVRADILSSIGASYLDRGDLTNAEIHLAEAVTLLQPLLGDSTKVALTQMALAETKRFQGDLKLSLELYESSYEMASAHLAPDHGQLLWHLKGLARVNRDLGRLDEAEDYLTQVVERVRANPGLHAEALYDLAMLQLELGRVSESIDRFAEALAVYENVYGAEHSENGPCLVGLARAQLASADIGLADPLGHVERAIVLLEATGARPRALIEAYAIRAELFRASGRSTAAVTSMAAALDEIERLRPETGGDERTRALFLGAYLGYFNRMIGWAVEDGALADAFHFGERARARVLLDQLAAARVDIKRGLDPAVAAKLAEREARVRAQLAEARYAVDEVRADASLEAAERHRRLESLQARIRQRQDGLRRIWQDTLVNSPLWRDRITTAGQLADLGRTQREALSNGTVLLVYHIGVEDSRLFVIDRESIEAFSLNVSRKAAATLDTSSGPLTRERLAALIDPGAVAVRGAGSSRRIAARRERAETTSLIDRLRAPTRWDNVAELSSALAALRKILVPPSVWKRVRGADEVIVVPDGTMHRMPFSALVTRPAGEWAMTRFWVDDGPPIRLAPSATFLVNVAEANRARALRTTGATRVLSVSDPVFDHEAVVAAAQEAALFAEDVVSERGNQDEAAEPSVRTRFAAAGGMLAPLPGTADETAALVEAFGRNDGRVQVLQRLAATEARVREALPGQEIVHLATHGLVDRTAVEMFAGLALTPPVTAEDLDDDGFLQLFEIYGLDIDASLVLLSACETSVGRLVEGEGVFSLSRGFLAAGAQRVVASLWSVDDASTASLVSAFAGALAKPADGTALQYSSLLQDAMRSVRRQQDYGDPFYWAAFTLTGAR